MKELWNKTKNWLNRNNHLLFVSITALVILGLVAMYSIGPFFDARINFESGFVFGKSLPFFIIGFLVMLGLSHLSKKWVVRFGWIWGIFAFLLILSTIIVPHYVMGAARYAFLLGIPVDPFAMMLPAYTVLMSHWLSNDKANKTRTAIYTTVLTLFIVVAAIRAPYVFMAQVYLFLFLIMGFKSRKTVPGVFCAGMVIVIVFVVLCGLAIFNLPHIQHRLFGMFHNVNYATQISVRAIKSSALIGSTQESLALLPKMVNGIDDFMFSSLVAKFGYLMGILVLTLYGFVAKRLTNITKATKNKFAKLLSISTLGLFAIYIVMALMVAFGLLATAAYWPFISYGNTMLLSWFILFGLVMAADNE